MPEDTTMELQPAVGTEVPSWVLEERELLTPENLTFHREFPRFRCPQGLAKLSSGYICEYCCNGKGIQR